MTEHNSHTGTPAHETIHHLKLVSKPLTPAELEALGKDARWDSLYGERAIAELRELREAVKQDAADTATVVALYAERNALREQNAKLAKALKAITRRVPIMGSTGEYRRGQLDALEACREVAALASVKEEAHA